MAILFTADEIKGFKAIGPGNNKPWKETVTVKVFGQEMAKEETVGETFGRQYEIAVFEDVCFQIPAGVTRRKIDAYGGYWFMSVEGVKFHLRSGAEDFISNKRRFGRVKVVITLKTVSYKLWNEKAEKFGIAPREDEHFVNVDIFPATNRAGDKTIQATRELFVVADGASPPDQTKVEWESPFAPGSARLVFQTRPERAPKALEAHAPSAE